MKKTKMIVLMTLNILLAISCKTTEEPNENNENNNSDMYLVKSTERKIQWKGKNQFSPSILRDKKSGSCMMWYVDGHKNPDEIHHKKSQDCSFTGNQFESSVFTQAMFSKLTGIPTNNLGHLGGPSVVKFENKYIMFFTTCLYNECHDTKHKQIWLVESTDGKNWTNPKGPILDDTYFSQPSVINYAYKDEKTEEEKEGLRLYFQNRGKGNHRIWAIGLDDKLRPMKKAVSVFKYTQPGVPILEPDVIKLEDRYHLFFSTLSPTTGSIRIHHVSSSDPLNFGIKGFKETVLIAPKDGSSPCGVDTPGAVSLDEKSFYLFYSQIKEIFIDGSCRRYHKIESSIVRDKFTVEKVEEKEEKEEESKEDPQ